MHNGMSIYQTKYCKTMFLALPCISYILFNRPIVGNTALLRQKSQQTHYYYRIALINICCCSLNKVSVKRQKLCRKNILT